MKQNLLFASKLVLLSFCMLLTVKTYAQTAVAPSAGDGTEGNPYQIESLENLIWMSENSSECSKFFIQTADIDATVTQNMNDGSGFQPISEFIGSYNGKGHVIDGLYINRGYYTGLFNHIGKVGMTFTYAYLDSINLTNVDITGDYYTGSLVGELWFGKVSNCSATGKVHGDRFTGGLIGFMGSQASKTYNYNSDLPDMENRGGNTFVYRCYTMIDLTASESYIGGIVGRMKDSRIEETVVFSRINIPFTRIGGIAGSASYSEIVNCYNYGAVVGVAVGGISGETESSVQIINCYTTSYVSGILTDKTGGIVGDNPNNASVINSFYDIDETFQTTSAGGIGYHTDVMITDTTYLNNSWDFIGETENGTSDIWGMVPGVNGGYPFLVWQWDGPAIETLELPDIIGYGSVTITDFPIAYEITGDIITATTDDPLEYTEIGEYTIEWTYEDSEGRKATQNQIVKVKTPTGIENNLENNLKLYPNPVNDILYISISELSNMEISVYDLTGKLKFSNKYNSELVKIDISNFESGVYVVSFESNANSFTRKIVKQ